MKIKDFLEKYCNNERIAELHSQIDKLNEQLESKQNQLSHQFKSHDRMQNLYQMSIILIVVLSITSLLTGLGLYLLASISNLWKLYMVIPIISFVPTVITAKSLLEKYQKKWNRKTSLLQNKVKRLSYDLNQNTKKLDILEQHRKEVDEIYNMYNCLGFSGFLESDLQLNDEQIQYYLNENVSLSSLIYMMNNEDLLNRLKREDFSKNELRITKSLSRYIDSNLKSLYYKKMAESYKKKYSYERYEDEFFIDEDEFSRSSYGR